MCRYRKSMDEVQKKMEKKFSMFSKNSKLLTKVVRVLNVDFLLCGFLCACSVALPHASLLARTQK
jgi:hypothetical protein